MNKKSHWRDFFCYDQQHSYLDHAASSQTPKSVVDEISCYYQTYRSNVGRGVYAFAEKTTYAYEHSRERIARLINASSQELVLTYGATDSLNMVANALAVNLLSPKQVILVSPFEHHSNLVPWQVLAKQLDCKIKLVPIDHDCNICWDQLSCMLEDLPVGLIAITHMSNVTGHVIDIKKLCKVAKGIPVVVDGTQAIAHLKVDVKDLGCAAYAWSSHKMYGPTGVGALYIHDQYWQDVIPYRTGGGMIDTVNYEYSAFKQGPQMLEAGTPPISAVLGFAEACRLLDQWDIDQMHLHEVQLIKHLKQALAQYPVTIYSAPESTIVSLAYEGAHAHDVATILAADHVMVRSGHHCCMPLMQYLNVDALTRISVGCYNDLSDIKRLLGALAKVKMVLKV